MEATFILQARMKAAVSGLDQGLEFVNGHELDGASSRQIPEKPEWGLRFVTVPYEKPIQATYLPASIRSEDYPALVDREVETIAAITVLVSYNWPKDSVRYRRTEKFVNAFFSKFDEFHKPPRHPLWKEVNLGASIPGWTRFPAAEEWLRNWRAGQAKSEEADFKQFMSGRTANESTDQLFREFMIWRSKGK